MSVTLVLIRREASLAACSVPKIFPLLPLSFHCISPKPIMHWLDRPASLLPSLLASHLPLHALTTASIIISNKPLCLHGTAIGREAPSKVILTNAILGFCSPATEVPHAEIAWSKKEITVSLVQWNVDSAITLVSKEELEHDVSHGSGLRPG